MRNHEVGDVVVEPTKQDDLTRFVEAYTEGLQDISSQHLVEISGVEPGSVDAINQVTASTRNQLVVLLELTTRKSYRYLSPEDHNLLNFILDEITLENRDIGGNWIGTVLERASSDTARDAIRAAMDREVWHQATQQLGISEYGVRAPRIYEVLDLASSDIAKDAMRSALDRDVWEELLLTLSLSRNPDNPVLESVLSRASTDDSRLAMQGALGSYFEHSVIDDIVNSVILRHPEQSWLRREDRARIKRVIDEIRVIRAEAAAEGREITDREIYLTYRRKVESSELDDDEARVHTEAAQIVSAMMGANPKGTLPF